MELENQPDAANRGDGGAHKELGDSLATTAKQSGQVLVIKVMMYLAGFFSSFILARLFGAAIVGEFALTLSIVNIAVIFSVFGLNTAMVKYSPIARASGVDGEENQVAYLGLRYSLIFAIVCAALLFAFSGVLSTSVFNIPELAGLLKVGAIGLIPLTISKTLGGIYQGARAASAFAMIFDLVDKVVLLVFIGTVAFLDLRISLYVAIAWLVNQFITVAILAVRTRRFHLDLVAGWRLAHARPAENVVLRRTLFRVASTMILVSVMVFLLGRLDIIMLGIFMEATDVGVYKIALVVAGLTTFVMASANSIFPSFIAELYDKGKMDQLAAIYSAVTKWIIIVTAPLVVSMLFYPTEILAFFGEEYVEGKSVLRIIAVGFFINAMVGTSGYMLSMTGRERLVLANNVTMAVINVLMNLVLIPRMGIVGAAVATAISIGTVNLAKVVEVKVFMNIMPYNRTYLPVVLGSAVTIALAFLAQPFVANAFVVTAVTLVNLLVAVAIAYRFRSETDDLVFERVARRLGKRKNRER